MTVGIRDDTLMGGGFASIAAGMAAIGAASVELSFGRDGTVRAIAGSEGDGGRLNLDTDAGRAALRDQCAAAGIRVSALMLGNNFNAPDVPAEIDWVRRAAEAARALGVPALRIDTIMRDERETPLDQRVARFRAALDVVLPATEATGVALGLENHGARGNEVEFLTQVVESYDSPRLGYTLDTGNFYWHGNPLSELYRIYERLAPRVKATHVKSIRYPQEIRETRREIGHRYGEFASPLDEGDIDFGRVIAILRGAGYDGDLTIENEALGRFPEDARAALLRRDVDHLKRLLG